MPIFADPVPRGAKVDMVENGTVGLKILKQIEGTLSAADLLGHVLSSNRTAHLFATHQWWDGTPRAELGRFGDTALEACGPR